MAEARYAYDLTPTRNPLRLLRAIWRTLRDPADTEQVAIVEAGFARSRLGRRFARWEEVLTALRGDPRTAAAVAGRRASAPVDLAALARLPEASLGATFARHCRARGLEPNLAQIAPANDVDWLLHHLVSTHDVWHVVTGWGNDEIGEYGLGAFYLAQLSGAPFFGFLLALAALSTVFRRRSFAEFMAALVAGHEMGRQAQPLLGVDWALLWETPLADVRARLSLSDARPLGEGIRAAA